MNAAARLCRIAPLIGRQIRLRLFLLGFRRLRAGGRGGLFLFFEDRGSSSDAVAFIEPQQANALRRAARLANLARVDADHFALVRDDHYVGFFAHLDGGDDRTIALGGLQVDHALAAARRDAVLGERCALTVTLFRDR